MYHCNWLNKHKKALSIELQQGFILFFPFFSLWKAQCAKRFFKTFEKRFKFRGFYFAIFKHRIFPWSLFLRNYPKITKSRKFTHAKITTFNVIGCQPQMTLFKFFYAMDLSYKLYSTIGNLSKSLHRKSMSAIEGQINVLFLIWKRIDFENLAKYA